MQKKQDIMNGDNLIFISSFFDLFVFLKAVIPETVEISQVLIRVLFF